MVGVDAAGLDLAAGVAPGDDALGECIGAATAGDADLEVGQLRQDQALLLEDLGQGGVKGVEVSAVQDLVDGEGQFVGSDDALGVLQFGDVRQDADRLAREGTRLPVGLPPQSLESSARLPRPPSQP